MATRGKKTKAEGRSSDGKFAEGNQLSVGNNGGVESKYRKAYHPNQVLKFALLGLTDKQMSELFDIAESTFNKWKIDFPEFSESIKKGKQEADANVASMLYKKAIGYTQKKTIPFKLKETVNGEGSKERIELVEVEDYYPPEVSAQFIWLKNRQPELWRDKKEVEFEDKRNVNLDKLSDSALDELENALKANEE